MITKILNGNIIYNKYSQEIKKKVEKCYLDYKIFPCISFIIINNNFSSNLYVKNKIIFCKKNLFTFLLFKSSKTIKISTFKNIIKILNENYEINSILIQNPIPKKFNKKFLFKLIKTNKDVERVNPFYTNNNFNKHVRVKSCITQSITYFLNKLNVKYNKINCVLLGFSETVGKPIFNELINKGFNITVINKNNKKINSILKIADIIIIGIGIPLFLSKNMISYGCVVFDIGINKLDKDVVGDANTVNLLGKASWITPVPGGIGPLTIFYLLKNTLNLYIYQKKVICRR